MMSLLVALCVLVVASVANAQVALEGYFIAKESCPAYESFHHETNPGDIHTEEDRAYPMLGKNKQAASHYQIEIRNAEPDRRWVAVTCGIHVVLADGSDGNPTPPPDGGGGDYVLAVSWQPAFCETKQDKPECTSQTAERFDADHFTLHGLWPQPRSKNYCSVPQQLINLDKSHDWDQLPAPNLTQQTREDLDRVMPGTQSRLHHHEWIKHGTCYGGEPADAYFKDALALMDTLNASAVRELFVASRGQSLTNEAIRNSFDAAFGPGAGARVEMECERDGNRRLLVGMLLHVKGTVSDSPDLGALLGAAPGVAPGCAAGIVDEVGLQ